MWGPPRPEDPAVATITQLALPVHLLHARSVLGAEAVGGGWSAPLGPPSLPTAGPGSMSLKQRGSPALQELQPGSISEWLGRGDPRVAVAWDPWSVRLLLWKQVFMGLEELALGHPDFKGRGTPTPGHPSQPRDQLK